MKTRELKAIRKRLGWTQAQLAEAVGVTSNSIARQERGELGIRESLARLLRLVAEQAEKNETAAHPESSRRDSAPKPAKSSRTRHSKNKSRGRTR